MIKMNAKFNQSPLINVTGNLNPLGMCLGLSTCFLIACKKNKVKEFWKDIENSFCPPKGQVLNASFIGGEGYVNLANRIQENLNEYHQDVEKILNEAKITKSVDDRAKVPFQNVNMRIYDLLEKQNAPYVILVIQGKTSAHAISLFVKKKTEVDIFEPNFGWITCTGKSLDETLSETTKVLEDIDKAYNGIFNDGIEILGYK